MSDDQDLSDDARFHAELDAYHYRASKGEIVRNGVRFNSETDVPTASALRAMLRDAHGMLRQANAENRELREALDAQTQFNSDLFKQQEQLRARQAAIQATLDSLSARIQ